MVIILQIDDQIVDLGSNCRAEELKLFWSALNGQAESTDQLDWYMGDVKVES